MSCEIFIMSRRQSSTNSVILNHNIDLDETEFVQNQITSFCIKNRNIKGNAADDGNQPHTANQITNSN